MKQLFILLTISLGFVSCKKFVDVGLPSDQVTTVGIFSTEESASSAVRGLYSRMMQANMQFCNGVMTLAPALSADELKTTSSNPAYDPFYNSAIAADNSIIVNNIWPPAYNYLYQANIIIENLSHSEINPSVASNLVAEAKFLRAFYHFYLVNCFGAVPLIITTDYTSNSTLGRADTDKIYGQIKDDLKDAEARLLNTSLTSNLRVNKWAVGAFLARVFLYHAEWANAEAEATKVINSGKFSMSADLSQVFKATSPEVILQFSPSITQIFNTAEGFNFIPSSSTALPPYALTNSLLNSFENGDQRKVEWTKGNVYNGTTYFYPYKYRVKSGTSGAAKSECNVVLRLAEQYLVRAEARAMQNKLTEGVQDLNVIRQRAGLSALPLSLSQSDLLSAIEQERRIELMFEWGHRWFDLKRTKRANDVLSIEKSSNWQPTDLLYPIPLSEILVNPALTQNPGY
jgi:starch-binding outer membrane protein, SusD/RagB family